MIILFCHREPFGYAQDKLRVAISDCHVAHAPRNDWLVGAAR
jgi:hypothetical protein